MAAASTTATIATMLWIAVLAVTLLRATAQWAPSSDRRMG
jgi:hypothetical protein